MPRLNEILGAIIADITSARQLADQRTLQLAKQYQSDPLLRHMPVPRLRLPEVTVDLPVVIERCQDPSAPAQSPPPFAAATANESPADRFVRAGEQVLHRIDAEKPAVPEARPPIEIHVLIASDAVKERGGTEGGNVMRLRLKLREEALEWSDDDDGRGEGNARLIPE